MHAQDERVVTAPVDTPDPAPAQDYAVGRVTEQLRTQVRRVHEVRTAYAAAQTRVRELLTALETAEAETFAALRQHAASLHTEETQLRTLTLEAYAKTGSKTPAPGVGVRVVKHVEYTEEAALAWARETNLALMLDRKAFEKIAIASPIPCAKVLEEPQATIAQDLTEAAQ